MRAPAPINPPPHPIPLPHRRHRSPAPRADFQRGRRAPVSRSHGTGAIFARNFSAYPRERLANWFISGSTDPLFPDALNLSPQRWPRSLFSPPATLLAKTWNHCGLRPFWTVPVNVSALRDAAQAQAFVPDLVYAIIMSREGIDSLRGVLDGLPAQVRVVLQIQDFFPTGTLGFMRALRRLAPRVAEVWGVSRPILDAGRATCPAFRS